MHHERKALGVDIVRGFTPGQDCTQDGTTVCALFEGTIHMQCWGEITRGTYTSM